jgi:voltage-gated potassium channel
VEAQLRYLRALASRFRITLSAAAALFGLVPLLYVAWYPQVAGERLHYGHALHHVYFLMFGQPSLEYVDDWLISALNFAVPPVGIAVVVDGIVRFAYLFFAKHRDDKEWIEMMTQTMRDHVIVAGAGKVGYRVAVQLLELGHEVAVVERDEKVPFVSALRDGGVAVLIDDFQSSQTLVRLNVKEAAAVVAASGDDLANLNLALDARRIKPDIRVVLRLFDDDLVDRVRVSFEADALSSSALAAPALALTALDPRVEHAFPVGGELMVVSHFEAKSGLPGMSVAELRDRHGAHVLSLRRSGVTAVSPGGEERVVAGDQLTVQATFPAYRRLRELAQEGKPPRAGRRG